VRYILFLPALKRRLFFDPITVGLKAHFPGLKARASTTQGHSSLKNGFNRIFGSSGPRLIGGSCSPYEECLSNDSIGLNRPLRFLFLSRPASVIRMLHLLKSRGMAHDTSQHIFSLSDKGIAIHGNE